MDAMTRAYLEAALWTSTDDGMDPSGGRPLDETYTVTDFAPEAVEKAERDCKAFAAEHIRRLEATGMTWAEIGHNLWLTRNRHGAGFWDRGLPEDIGRALTDAAHALGETDAYAAKQVHLS